MNNTEREVNGTGLTKEKFLDDVRPLLDEALEHKIGVPSVELSLATGELEGSEELMIYFSEEGAPWFSRIELSPERLFVNKYEPEIGDWNSTSVGVGSNEGKTRSFIIGTGIPMRDANESDWETVLEKAKSALATAVSAQSKELESERVREDMTGEDQVFISEYDKMFQALSDKALKYPSVLYPGAEYAVVTGHDKSGAWFQMQNFYPRESESGSKRPVRRLLIVNDPNKGFVERGIEILESPAEVKWYRQEGIYRGTPLSNVEKNWAINATKEIVLASKQV